MDFDFNEAGVRALEGEVDNLSAWVTRGIAFQARQNCPVKTGKLRRTIVSHGNKVYCGDDETPYWAAQEFGSEPHIIKPKQKGMGRGHRRKKALYWPGADHPVALVHHPGTPEVAFMRRALYGDRWRTATEVSA